MLLNVAIVSVVALTSSTALAGCAIAWAGPEQIDSPVPMAESLGASGVPTNTTTGMTAGPETRQRNPAQQNKKLGTVTDNFSNKNAAPTKDATHPGERNLQKKPSKRIIYEDDAFKDQRGDLN